jgi:hypothetical protein
VAHGVLEIMNLMGIHEVEPDEFKEREFPYPAYVQLKGSDLYAHKVTGKYNRNEFHDHPENYNCLFPEYVSCCDILMNGVYWQPGIPRLFETSQVSEDSFRIQTIADITDDTNGSVPINLGDQTIENPVYGVDRKAITKTAPYLPGSVDIMAVGNLPNELPRDASRYFGEQLIKFVLADLVNNGSEVIERATLLKHGRLTEQYAYLREYAGL